MRTILRSSFLAAAALAAAAVPAGAQPAEWAAHAGVFNATKSPSSAEAGFEARFASRWPDTVFTAGVAGTEDASFWVYGGARYTFTLDRRWAFSMGLALAVYEEGDGKDLGGPLEFRSSYEISRRLGERSRLGLVFYHVSNAGVYELNPGSNSIVLAWTRR